MHKMNDSDLEEGEIPDDSPSSPCNNDRKSRELPRRYVIQDNKGTHVHKHKKDCRHAIRYHAKKLSKLKKSPIKSKDNSKKHHKSTCPHDKSHKLANKSDSLEKNYLFSKNGRSFPKQSLIAEMESSLKHHRLINKKNARHKPKINKNLPEMEEVKISSDGDLPEKDLKNMDFQSKNNSSSDLNQCDKKLIKNNDLSNFIDNNINLPNSSTNNSPEINDEESEDEEELRRIALATFAKRKTVEEPSENPVKNVDDIHKSSATDIQITHCETSIPESDNYEVVDMEVDEDIQSSIEILEASMKDQDAEFMENLYVIDTKPSTEDHKSEPSSELEAINNSSDDDFETDILRAELIDSMYRKKNLKREVVVEPKQVINTQHEQVPLVPKKNFINNYKKPNGKFYRKHIKPLKLVARKNLVKSGKMQYNVKRTAAPTNQLQLNNKSSERLIIALNDESSSEESENSNENSVPENPVASIEALISDCRQNSESTKKTEETVKEVSKAVSCLSKAQQEEYETLVKILAEKRKVPGSTKIFKNKNNSVHSPLDNLKRLEEKLIGFKEVLQRKKESVVFLSKEVETNKLSYMKSKLSAQHLKEQYSAAEKVRKADLCAWSKSCTHLKNLKKTITNLENKINRLQNLCSNAGASIQGKTHNLSLFTSSNNTPKV